MFKLLAILITGCLTPQTQVLHATQVEQVLKSSVLIHIKTIETNQHTLATRGEIIGCSGTYIAPNTVLTAAHCVSEGTIMNIWVRGTDHHSLEARLIKLNPSKDLALLVVISATPHSYAHLAPQLAQGDGIINVGSPAAFEFLISEGIVAQVHVASKPYSSLYTLTTAMINPGSSGGGTFNLNGELVGVNTMAPLGMFGWAGISMAVSLEDITAFLK
jgi:serine protease Do